MISSSIVKRLENIQRFYALLSQLESKCGGMRKLADSHGSMEWSRRGVYFFFEPGEVRSTSGQGLRVVRVGTHALKSGSKTTLWNRLSQHQGTQKTGGGNHRGSVFRLHVGAALIEQGEWESGITEHWGKGSNAPREIRQNELPLEKSVSSHICNMPFLFLEVNDEPGPDSMRGFIERNAIALLSNTNQSDPVDPPSSQWLGFCAQRESIRNSGLWNVNHVNDEYEPSFLVVIRELVSR